MLAVLSPISPFCHSFLGTPFGTVHTIMDCQLFTIRDQIEPKGRQATYNGLAILCTVLSADSGRQWQTVADSGRQVAVMADGDKNALI